ncbi:MAG TPA: SprT family zinc-dependent metalloprotease [Salinivirgaceae bacterium]|nr:SprT family zinc-dependent metalloprotease [Salinivirgaceae bacterium]
MTSFFDIEFGTITLLQRKNIRKITLRLIDNGKISISAPQRANHRQIAEFVDQHRLQIKYWISTLPKNINPKLFSPECLPRSRYFEWILKKSMIAQPKSAVINKKVTIEIPVDWGWEEPQVQDFIKQVMLKILRIEANIYLPRRLAELASLYGFTVRKLSIKKLKSRWGSCTKDLKINLNLYLMLLPDHLIDHVLIHELCHTKVLNHGDKFHALMQEINPNYKTLDAEIRKFRSGL